MSVRPTNVFDAPCASWPGYAGNNGCESFEPNPIKAKSEMPQRFLRPGLTTSQRFNAVTWQAQSLFVRLLTLVDDFGRYDAEPRLLRSHAFPFGDPYGQEILLKTIDSMCEQLAGAGLVIFYKAGEKKYLQLARWQERPRANTSKYPEFDNNCEQMFADVSKCSAPSSSSSSSSSSLSHRHSSDGSHKTNTSEPDDNVWRTGLLNDPAYSHINVPAEFSKMQRWCEVNKKQPTRRRFINWLNRIEPAMQERKTSRSVRAQPARSERPPAITDEQIAKNKAVIGPLIADLAAKLTGQVENPS